MNKKIVGLRIKTIRQKKSLTQEELSLLTNINIKTISNYESGRSFPSLKNLFTISKVLKVPPEYFISSDPEINVVSRLYMIQHNLEEIKKEVNEIKNDLKLNN